MSEDLVGILVFGLICFLVVGGIGLGVYFYQQQQARIAESYKHICRLYNGHFVEPGWFQPAMAQFPTKSGLCVLDIFTTGGKHKKSYTRLMIPWPDPHLYLNIAPQGFFGMLGEMVGAGDQKLGDPAFDDRYYISTNLPQYLPRIVGPDARMRLNNLYDILGNYEIDWTIEGGGMRVLKFGIIDDPQTLQLFVQESLALYDAALGTAATPGGYGNPAAPGGPQGYGPPGGYRP